MYRSRECENSISGMQYNNVFNSLIHHQKEFLLGKAKLSSAEFWCSNLFPSTFDSFLSIPLPEYCQYNLFGEYDHRDSVLGLVIHWNQEAILIKSSIPRYKSVQSADCAALRSRTFPGLSNLIFFSGVVSSEWFLLRLNSGTTFTSDQG